MDSGSIVLSLSLSRRVRKIEHVFLDEKRKASSECEHIFQYCLILNVTKIW